MTRPNTHDWGLFQRALVRLAPTGMIHVVQEYEHAHRPLIACHRSWGELVVGRVVESLVGRTLVGVGTLPSFVDLDHEDLHALIGLDIVEHRALRWRWPIERCNACRDHSDVPAWRIWLPDPDRPGVSVAINLATAMPEDQFFDPDKGHRWHADTCVRPGTRRPRALQKGGRR